MSVDPLLVNTNVDDSNSDDDEKMPVAPSSQAAPVTSYSQKRGKHYKMTSMIGTLEMQKEPIPMNHRQVISY